MELGEKLVILFHGCPVGSEHQAEMKLVWWLFLFLDFWDLFLADEGKTPGPPHVLIPNGELQGQRIRVRGAERDVEVFLGIPYAKPPVGSLRFSPPQLAEPWTGLRDATSYPPMCLQDPLAGQALSDAFANTGQKISLRVMEDCLYLNIYVPAHSDKAELLPVMVWIHGGGLLLGAASTYDGTGDEHAQGNWGLLDQVAALQWIQENIANFGGDPESVTIFGNSAGGFSSSAHVLSPLSKGLFHKAISESGVAITDVLFDAHPGKLAKKIAGSISCPTSSSAEMVRCLRGKTESEILLATLKMDFTRLHLGGEEQHVIFFPAVVDGHFFPKSPRELLAEKNFNNLPYLLGVNDDEFGWILPQLLQFPDITKGLDRETVNLLLRSSEQLTRVAPQDLPLVADEYFQDLQDPVQLRDQFLALLRDAVFLASTILTARYHRDFVKVDHGDEIAFVFGKPFFTDNATEEDKMLSKVIMKYWANFARTGNPNGAGLVTWPRYDLSEQYLEIDLKQKVGRKLKEKAVAFWTKTLPEKVAKEKGCTEL
ncbi:putative Carboxylic ester hydrolase protein [Naja naja]|nr:putative Carboxylic ester hydrolase protein [Naja naja]